MLNKVFFYIGWFVFANNASTEKMWIMRSKKRLKDGHERCRLFRQFKVCRPDSASAAGQIRCCQAICQSHSNVIMEPVSLSS